MKRILALALCLVLALGVFAGCTSSGGETTATPAASTGSSGTTSSGSSGNSGSTATAAPADEGEEENTSGLPLTDSLTEIEIWQPWAIVGFSSFLSDWNDSLGYKLLERDTNVHVNWSIPAYGSENEDFQLLIASQMYPDVISNFTAYYSQGLIHAVENEIALEIDGIVDQYMPNYKSWISDASTKRKVTTDAGYMAALYCIDNMPQTPWVGNGIRQDWLDRVGMSTPYTYDELHDVLVAFRDQIAECESPMLLDGMNIGGDNIGGLMAGGFGVYGDFYAENGTTVTYGPTHPEYLDYLRLMRSWYAEGLIDKDFTTRGAFSDAISYTFANKTGYCANFSNIGTWEELSQRSEDSNYNMVAVPSPVLHKGDVNHFGIVQENVELGAVITTQCSDVPLVARWYDYQYTETGAMYLNYGEEGTTYYFDPNGDPCLSTEKMEAYYGSTIGTCAQANGPISQAHLRYFWHGRPSRNMDSGVNQTYIDAGDIWAANTADWMIPSFVTMTSEESAAYNAVYNDLNTYVDEISVKFIMGAASEEDLVTMQNTIANMGVDRCIAIQQAALDRYLAR